MTPAHALLLVLCGLLVCAHPVVADGPGPDTRYVYDSTAVSPADVDDVDTAIRADSDGAVVYGDTADLVRRAARETVRVDAESLSSSARRLREVTFVADDVRGEHYRVDLSVEDEDAVLSARPVSGRTVLSELATPRTETDGVVGDVVRTGVSRVWEREAGGVVRTTDGYLVVRLVESETVPDPYRLPKLVGYAVGVAATVVGAVELASARPGADGER